MATLRLNKMWVNLLDTGVGVSAYSSDRSSNRNVRGEVRTYAGGNQRSVTTKGTRGAVTFKLRDVTVTDMNTLEGWFGQSVVVRDHRGQRWFGVFFSLDISERRHIDYYDISLTVYQITYQEGS